MESQQTRRARVRTCSQQKTLCREDFPSLTTLSFLTEADVGRRDVPSLVITIVVSPIAAAGSGPVDLLGPTGNFHPTRGRTGFGVRHLQSFFIHTFQRTN